MRLTLPVLPTFVPPLHSASRQMARTNMPQFEGIDTYHSQLKPLASYAEAQPGGSQFLKLYKTMAPGAKEPWLFAHRENSKGAVHAITLIEDAKGEEKIHLLVQKSPPLGGKPIVQLAAGTWGDNKASETALEAANREVREETGYKVKSSQFVVDQMFATSAGITDEAKAIALTRVTGKPSDKNREAQEKVSIIDTIDEPTETFRDYDKFLLWLKKMDEKGYMVGMDVLAARALLPPKKGTAATGLKA